MAVQKRRQSKARKNQRRAQWMKVDAPSLSKCAHCGETHLSHRACPACGKYGKASEARAVFVPKSAEESESKSA